MEDRRKFEMATRHVHAMEGFYIHAGVFVLTIGILVVVNLMQSGTWWVQWPFLGWGLGLLGHGLAVFGKTPQRLHTWRQRKIREIVDR
jgi:hypothetical protein